MRAFFLGLVCQHRTKGHVADALDPLDTRVELAIDDNSPFVVLLRANCFEIEALGVRPTADRDEDDVSFKLLIRENWHGR